jgi:hypothetical protein
MKSTGKKKSASRKSLTVRAWNAGNMPDVVLQMTKDQAVELLAICEALAGKFSGVDDIGMALIEARGMEGRLYSQWSKEGRLTIKLESCDRVAS